MHLFEETSSAIFSDCRTWRYVLWRMWDDSKPMMAVIGLNPSTADETKDDPTIRRCKDFAKRWGYGGLYMLNLFAYRATKPADMKKAADPVGPENDDYLRRYGLMAGFRLAAWGKDGGFRNRDNEVLRLFTDLHCLKKTKEGHPWHPLYVAADTKPIAFCLNAAQS